MGDARSRIDPEAFQPHEAFCGQRPAIVTKAEFVSSGFSGAHLSHVRFNGYRVPSTMVLELQRVLKAGDGYLFPSLLPHRFRNVGDTPCVVISACTPPTF